MKKYCIALLITISFLPLSHAVSAQENEVNSTPATPRWVSEKGYWVMETNKNKPGKCIVYFYTNDHELVYKETMEGVSLNPEKRKIKMHLKRALENCIADWEKQRRPRENEGLVIRRFRNDARRL